MQNKWLVPSGNLSLENSRYSSNILEVLESGELIGGRFVEKFEKELAVYLGVNYVISTASGTDSLILALLSLEIPSNSKIAVANNAGGYASLAALSAGMTPIFCDVSENSGLIDLQSLEKLECVPDVLIITHLYGQMLDMKEITNWTGKNEVILIEDCAQAMGAKFGDKYAGTFGEIGCFSFYPTKNLGGIGDGGAIVSNSGKFADRIRLLKQYGWKEKYNSEIDKGRNSRLDAINASVLSAKLKSLELQNITRRNILNAYIQAIPKENFLIDGELDEKHVAHLAVLRVNEPNTFIKFFANNSIQIARHYPFPDSTQKGLNFKSSRVDTPNTVILCKSVVSLPLFPELTNIQIELVANTLFQWHREFGNYE